MALTITEPKARTFSETLSDGVQYEGTIDSNTLAGDFSLTVLAKAPFGPYGKPVGRFDQNFDKAGHQGISVYQLANDLKTKMIEHCSNATAHSTGQQSMAALSAVPAATTPTTLDNLVTGLITAWGTHITDAEKSSAWAYHGKKEDANCGLESTTHTTQDHEISILNDLKAKFNTHTSYGQLYNGAGQPITSVHGEVTTLSTSYIAHMQKDIVEPGLVY